MKRTASARWSGDLKTGKGSISTQSGILADTRYSFTTRFEDGAGTNPEELIAGAHAGCFTMALSLILGQAGFTADSLETKATLTLDKLEAGFAIMAIHLDLTGKVPNVDAAKFRELAGVAKANCLVSKILNIPISMTATLAS